MLSFKSQSSPIRLNKHLASLGIASRRKIDQLLEQGKIKVNDQRARLGQKVNPLKDEISLNGKIIAQPENQQLFYFKLNKPPGIVSTVTDPDGRMTVIDLFHRAIQKGKNKQSISKQTSQDAGQIDPVSADSAPEDTAANLRLYPVGRLDIDSEGLILLTNDGELTHKLTHPRYHLVKKYHLWITGQVTGNKLAALRRGIHLKDGPTAPAEVEILEHSPKMIKAVKQQIAINALPVKLEISIHEGRKRQIRRMAASLDWEVLRLKRMAIGPLELGDLEPGELRELSEEEVSALKEAVL